MKLYVVLLALWFGGGLLAGQATPPPLVELKQNYPNPFNPATTIPFSLNGALFADGHRPKVSLRIYNVLAQLVAGQLRRLGKRCRCRHYEARGHDQCSDVHRFPFVFELTHESRDSGAETRSNCGQPAQIA